MNEPYYFEQLRVGDRWETRARTITETDVVNFAGLTGDYDPLHMDREFAKHMPYGRPIAHGLLGLSFVAGLGSHFPMVRTVAFVAVRNWEFLLPAYVGDTVHAVIEVAELKANGRRRGTVMWKRQLVNHKGDVIQKGVFETLVERSPNNREAPAGRTKQSARPAAAGSTRRAKKPAAGKKSRGRPSSRRAAEQSPQLQVVSEFSASEAKSRDSSARPVGKAASA